MQCEVRMTEITFTSAQITAFFLRGLFVAAVPFIAFAYLRKKHGGRFYPVLIGAVSLMLLSLPRAVVRSIAVAGSDSFPTKFIAADLIGAVFEECGRYIAMKHAMPNHDTTADALCYGIGHGGVEAFSTAFHQFGFWILCMQYSGASVLQDSPIAEQLQVLAAQSTLIVIEMTFSETLGLAFHMTMSVLIATAVHYADSRKYIPIAIVLHALINFVNLALGLIAEVCIFIGIVCYVYYQRRRLRNTA